jgi:hypothetical protein
MGFFSKKTERDTEDFCRDFYDSVVFSREQPDFWTEFCANTQKQIGDRDAALMSVGLSELCDELRALRLEVFGIAWLHNVKSISAARQSEFTKRYLEEYGEYELWEIMGIYNQATARSTTGGHDSQSAAGRSHLAKLDGLRADHFDTWVELGYDSIAAARAANRLGSDIGWKQNRTQSYLSFALTDQLAVEVNKDARLVVMAAIVGFYRGSKDAIKEVRIVE